MPEIRPRETELMAKVLPEDYGQKTFVGGAMLDDMSRDELYAVIKWQQERMFPTIYRAGDEKFDGPSAGNQRVRQ